MQGRGIDLYIAKRIVENNGGKTVANSVKNVGTTFEIYILHKSEVNREETKKDTVHR